MSVREDAVAAIVAAVEGITSAPLVVRNAEAPLTVGATGYIVVRDGDRLNVDATLGANKTYFITHRVDLEVMAGGEDREDDLDALIDAVDAAITADRSLGGLISYLETTIEEIGTLSAEGAGALKAALLAVTIEYESAAACG